MFSLGGNLEFLSSRQYMQSMKPTPRMPTRFEVPVLPESLRRQPAGTGIAPARFNGKTVDRGNK